MQIVCPECNGNIKFQADILADTTNDQITAIKVTPQAGGFLSAMEVADTIKHWDKMLKTCAKDCGFNFSHSVITKIETGDDNSVKIFFLSVFKKNKPQQGSFFK